MLNVTSNVQIYLCTAPTDMRKSFDGLTTLVASAMSKDVLSGHLFLFLNRRRDRIKLMWWDRDGLAIWMKRLQAGTFEIPKAGTDQACLELDTTQLAMLLTGVSMQSAQRRKRFALAS
jgi:transposase